MIWSETGLLGHSITAYVESSDLCYTFDMFQEAVMRKCSVVCASGDPRNSTSDAEIRRADYIFRMTFNVEVCKISEKFPDQIDGVRGKYL